jgi:hypothetical protein
VLTVGNAVKPTTKLLTTVDTCGVVNNPYALYTCNLVHANAAAKLGCSVAEMTNDGMFIFSSDKVKVYSAGIKNKQDKETLR